jgi:outer membrane protein assembly factor BamB
MKKILSVFILVAVSLLSSSPVFCDDWTVGVGGKPSRYSMSFESGPTGPDLLWQGGISAVIAQQAVIEGDVVIMARIFNLTDVLHGTVIVAHDLYTGDTVWTADLPVDFPSTDWRNRVSAVREGKVYATRSGNTNASYLYALDITDGSIVWKSDSLIDESSTEGVTFADNGDIVAGNFTNIMRIDATDGSTVWKTQRSSPTSGGSEVAVFGYSIYGWEADASGPKISVYDINSGGKLYSSHGIGGGFVQQVGPFVGPDGTVYAPRTQNNSLTDSLVAFVDIDTALEVKWSVPLGYVPFASFGVGPDGSVYSYSQNSEVVRIEPNSGVVIDTSPQILLDFPPQPRMAIDTNGTVFVTNGGFSNGALYSFNPDLSLRWSESITNVNVGGPAIGQGGVLIVCGIGTDVRAYQGGTRLVEDDPGTGKQDPLRVEIYPNPFISEVRIQISEVGSPSTGSGQVCVGIYDITGREVRKFSVPSSQFLVQSVTWDGKDREGQDLPAGTYILKAQFEHYSVKKKIVIIR